MKNRRFLAICLLLAFCFVPCTSSKASNSIGAALKKAYEGRTQGEIRFYGRSLDDMNSRLLDLVPSSGSESVLPGVLEGWRSGPAARANYRLLLKVVDKYNVWTKNYEVPIRIGRDAIQVKRWEALRPLILPESIGMGIELDLGWSRPDGDDALWRGKQGALAYEMLLLFKCLDNPPGDMANPNASVSWVEKEAGTQRAARYHGMKGRLHQAFHGEYRFEELEIPDPSEDAPIRIQNLLSRLGYRNPEENLLAFIKRKDAFLTDLLGLIRGYQSGSNSTSATTVNWFTCGSRWFPPLTLYMPETAEKQMVKAIKKREGDTFRFFENGPTSPSIQSPVLREISQSVLQCQVKAMTPQGKIFFPDAPWSTWTSKTGDASTAPSGQRETTSTTGFIKMPIERPPENRLGPARAWSTICQWVAETVRHKGNGPIHLREGDSIDISSLWLFAFGEKELADALSTVPGTTFVQEKVEDDNQVQVKVDQVIADQRVHVQVLQGNQVLDQKSFSIEGPWPAWFASPRFPWSDGLKIPPRLIPWGLCIVGIWAAIFAIRRNRESTRFEGMRRLPLSCLIIAVALTILMGIFGPQPSGCKEIGGIVEFEIPADRTLTDIQKTFMQKISRSVFNVLAGMSDAKDVHTVTRNWSQRFWFFISSPFRFSEVEGRGQGVGVSSEKTRIALHHFDFRIRPVCWGGENPRTIQGRIAPGNGDRFVEDMAKVMKADGEPDAPKSLLFGSPADATFCLAFYGGDHGRLDPPPIQPPLFDASPSFAVFMPGPTRDGNHARGLLSQNRWEWTRERAKTSVSLMKGVGTPLKSALNLPWKPDDTANSPEDLDLKTRAWWEQVKSEAKSGAIEKVGQEVAARSFNLFQDSRLPSSKTELALPNYAVWGRFVGSVICLLLACLLVITGQQGLWSWKTFVQTLLWTSCAITIAVLALGAWYATVGGEAFSYEGSIIRSLQFALTALLVVTILLTVFRSGLCIYNKRRPSKFADAISAEYLFRLKSVRRGVVRTLVPLLGLVLMAGACGIWVGGLAQAPGRSSWWLLPIDYPNGLLAGLGLWGTGLFCILFPGSKQDEKRVSIDKRLERRKDVDIFSGQSK